MIRKWIALCVLAASACAGRASQVTESPGGAGETVYASGYGGQITLLGFDPESGALAVRARVPSGAAPSYLAFSRDGRFAYAVDEASSQVLAYAIERDGGLRELGRAASGGSGPAHLAVHPSGRWIAVANYGSGETAILPLDAGGAVGAPVATRRGPNGDCKHAHQAVFERSGAHLLVPCLGNDYVVQYRFREGTLSFAEPAVVPVAGGPRHVALDPVERRAYVLSENESVITAFDYDAGVLRGPSSVPSHRGTAGKSAHVEVHPSGRWLYASNRAENSLGVFELAPGLAPSPVEFVTDGLATPRHFSVHPSGRWLLVANQAGPQDVVVFAIDQKTGRLTRTAAAAVGGEPAFVGVVGRSGGRSEPTR